MSEAKTKTQIATEDNIKSAAENKLNKDQLLDATEMSDELNIGDSMLELLVNRKVVPFITVKGMRQFRKDETLEAVHHCAVKSAPLIQKKKRKRVANCRKKGAAK